MILTTTIIPAFYFTAFITTVKIELVLFSMTLGNISFVMSGTILRVTIIPAFYFTAFITTVKVEIILLSMTLDNITCHEWNDTKSDNHYYNTAFITAVKVEQGTFKYDP